MCLKITIKFFFLKSKLLVFLFGSFYSIPCSVITEPSLNTEAKLAELSFV